MKALFDRWREIHGASVAPSTVRRYAPSVASLDAFTAGKDVRQLTEDDVWDWAKQRVGEGRSARTVNRNDVAAVTSISAGRAAEMEAASVRTTRPRA